MAGNPNCPPETLGRLAANFHVGAAVGGAAAANPACPSSALACLARAVGYKTVRVALAVDADPAIAEALAANPRCPAATIDDTISRNRLHKVRRIAAANPAWGQRRSAG